MFNFFSSNKKILLLFMGAAVLFFPTNRVEAGASVVPQVIDKQVCARDIIELSAELKNTGENDLSIVPLVYDMTAEGRERLDEPTEKDKSSSLAHWIRISRGQISLKPGESRTISFKVEVNLSARPGKYHALIVFAPGAEILLNFEVTENAVEKAQIKKFLAEKSIFVNLPINFLLDIENIGNKEVNPRGHIYIYNRKGEEIGDVPINQGDSMVEPSSLASFSESWNGAGLFGNYKARVVLDYGKADSIQDTIYFWVLPVKIIVLFGAGLFCLILLLFILKFTKRDLEPEPVFAKSAKQYPAGPGVIDLRDGE